MKQIAAYCDKTEQKTPKNINETETILKKQLKKENYEEIKSTIISSETTTKKLLQQRKFKKFTSLKYKPKSAVKTTMLTTMKEVEQLKNNLDQQNQAMQKH